MKKTQISRWPSASVADRIRSVITRQPYYESSNFWMEHDGTKWMKDPVWDKCFPKMEASSKTEAIRKYCEYYYAEAERIAAKLGERFKFVETNQLNERSYQPELLRFVGDRKSTRLNSSHQIISYAVFCLKKKKKLFRAPTNLNSSASYL